MADARVWLAEAHLESWSPRQAEVQFRESLRYRESTLGEDHPKVAEARCGLGRALAAQGRWSEAAPLIERGYLAYARWGLAHRDAVEATRRALAEATAVFEASR